MSCYDRGMYDEALERLQESLVLFNKSNLSDEVELMANIFIGMGITYYAQGNVDIAMEMYGRVVEALEDRFGKKYPGLVSALINMGLIQSNQHKFDEALETFLRARSLAESMPLSADIYSCGDF